MIPIDYDAIVFEEENNYIAFCPELDISSCGDSVNHAKEMLKEAIRLFIEEAKKMGTLNDILEEAKFKQDAGGRWIPPRLVATEKIRIA